MDQEYFQFKTAAIEETINGFLAQGKKIFVGTSFQTHSIPLLHIISRINSDIPVYFIDTGFHFSETLIFKERITNLLGLNLISVRSMIDRSEQIGSDGKPLHTSDPDRCCYLNKIKPLEPVLQSHDVWINGIRADQNDNRRQMGKIINGPFDTLRYHPMLEWNSKEIFYYRKLFNLPSHPLEEEGYVSIGCRPCTQKVDPFGDERSGRWVGMNKTECGLHTILVGKSA